MVVNKHQSFIQDLKDISNKYSSNSINFINFAVQCESHPIADILRKRFALFRLMNLDNSTE